MALSNAERSRQYAERHPERVAAAQKKWRQENKEWHKAWREENPDKLAQYARTNRDRLKRDAPDRILLAGARARARSKGLEFSITVDDITIPARCPYLDIELLACVGAHCPTSPTLDRIDTTRGYVPGNVEVISYKANSMKRDATIEELLVFTDNVRRKFGAGE